MTQTAEAIKLKTIWQTNIGWCRACPSCQTPIEHKGDRAKSRAVFRQSYLCRECVYKSQRNIVKSDQTKQRMSEAKKGKMLSEECKRKMSHSQQKRFRSDANRIKQSQSLKAAWNNSLIKSNYYEGLKKTQWLKVRCDKGQLELLNKWNNLGFMFEPNYQIHNENFLCYLDGYDKAHNIVLEYDSKYHTSPNQKLKDTIRQNKIIQILQPKSFGDTTTSQNSLVT